jgi:hypothetical protein
VKTVLLNDLQTLARQKTTYIAIAFFLGIGILTGYKFNISVGDELAVNASYSVGFMIGLLSLAIILIATVLAFPLLFKEQDANYELIVFSTPIAKNRFAFARFLSFNLLTLFGFFCLISGYVLGIHLAKDVLLNPGFQFWHFAYPFLIFGVVNTLVICSVLFYVAQSYKNKLMVAIVGVLLYVLYMITLLFSNAPFMAQAMPQSLFVQRISAIVDIFGLSGYFFEAKDLSLEQRNYQVVPLSNLLLINRMASIVLAFGMLLLGVRSFSFLPKFKKKSRKKLIITGVKPSINPFATAVTEFNKKSKWKAILSYIKVDTIYIFKSIPFIATVLLLVFYVGVEMYDDINKGIRIPQMYASSGLLVQTINSTFYPLGTLFTVYFVNDLFWRSNSSRFSVLEQTTFYATQKLVGHIGSIAVLLTTLTLIIIAEALAFQVFFKHLIFDARAYFGAVLFNTLPLVLLGLFMILINLLSKNKSIALGVSILCFLVLATPISKSIFTSSLLRFFSGYRGSYSEFIGFGDYVNPYSLRLVFGFSILILLFMGYYFKRNNKDRKVLMVGMVLSLMIALISSSIYLRNYHPKKEKEEVINAQLMYEKQFRKYQNMAQPTIKKVQTKVHLYPDEQSYTIEGQYTLVNKHDQPIDSVLISVPEEMKIRSMVFQYGQENFELNDTNSELVLPHPIQPNDSVQLQFKLDYQWFAVNGHDSFNAIIENGSFMRISRYYPQFGYDSDREIKDSITRAKYGLSLGTSFTKLEAPKKYLNDAIDLNIQISTTGDQVAVGTGELKKQWQQGERNYFAYAAQSIPFRFAISSADYQVKSVKHHNIDIRVYHHPEHSSNVEHLIENTKLTLDYCEEHFGPYPFKTVNYAEVSSFTQGFAGTAYPGSIFLTEHMTFNANLTAGKQQDVINELAGHEVSHFWWGTHQIQPDFREGYSMLTESLAMYTEMMIYKQMYGRDKMWERLAIHQQIYDAEKGFNQRKSILKVAPGETYLAYSKGALVFVELSELIGESVLNKALKNFLSNNRYPNNKPISTDLLSVILEVADPIYHSKIKSLFQ